MNFDVKHLVQEIFDQEDQMMSRVASNILEHIDKNIEKAGNNRKRIVRLLKMKSFIKRTFKQNETLPV